MSLRIIKKGVLDTIQAASRYGGQHLGINPGGAADAVAYSVANMLVANNSGEAAIEMAYPAATILFEKNALIALSGGDFSPHLNGAPVHINTPLAVAAGSVLEHTKIASGYCCYLAVKGGLAASRWLGSYSTNIKAKAGGHFGRKLATGDIISFNDEFNFSGLLANRSFLKLGWQAKVAPLYTNGNIIRICLGHEYEMLDATSKNILQNAAFAVTRQSDRMGMRLQGIALKQTVHSEMVSTGVTRGTVQLLPNGQLVILMADHQTTGGYPRIGHVISADLPTLAQTAPGREICFTCIGGNEAEALLLKQHTYLQQLQFACNLRLEEFLYNHANH